MCGIAGYLDFSSRISNETMVSNVQEMCRVIEHRGPDEHGIYSAPNFPIVFGHQRLSILDLASGQQPLKNHDGDLVIVFNGEIYNYRELREQLKALGHFFRTQSDTEVLVQSYKEWGDECVQHLRGMFAFSIWDIKRQRLFCARDRLGIKPFYYYKDNKSFVFCSEIKGILANKSVEKKFNIEPLSDFLASSYSPGEQTFFQNLHKLPPAHTLSISSGKLEIKPYWAITETVKDAQTLGFEESALSFKEQLQKAIQIRLVSDVPIGAFLSGGLDSSSIVALMSKQLDKPVLTHCVGFNDEGLDERKHAQTVSRFLKTNHTDQLVNIDVGATLDKIIWHMDEPFADASAIPTYYLCESTRKRVKVCLSGDGGDELLAGYAWYAELDRMLKLDKFIPAWLRNSGMVEKFAALPYFMRGATLLKNVSASPINRHINLMTYFNENSILNLLSDDYKAAHVKRLHPLNKIYEGLPSSWDDIKRAQLADVQSYLVEDILMKVDKMSMAHGLEVRVPFLDHELVEFLFRQPTSYKLLAGNQKRLLKKAMASALPQETINRKKQGFSVPIREWLLGDLKERVGDLLLSSTTSASGAFNTREVELVWKRLQSKSGNTIDLSHHIWTLLCFEMWHQQYL